MTNRYQILPAGSLIDEYKFYVNTNNLAELDIMTKAIDDAKAKELFTLVKDAGLPVARSLVYNYEQQYWRIA